MIEVICALIAGLCTIVCAIIGAVSLRSQKRSERRETVRREETLLSLQMIDATLQLAVVTANALTDGHNNGNVEAARKAAEDAQARYKKFMQEQTAAAVAK